MSRKVILFLSLAEKLNIALDDHLDVFLRERPFLLDRSKPLVILDLSSQRKEIELRIAPILHELGKIKL